MVKVVTYRDKKPSDNQQAWWSEKQKFEVVSAYVLLGNVAQVSRLTGIPEITVRKWKASPWWKEAEGEIRLSSKVQLSGKLTKAIELANIALEDRLVNGDFQYDYKTGKMIRKPVNADLALRALDRLIDRQEMLDNSMKKLEVTTDEGTNERLAKLAEQFVNFAKAKTIEAKIIGDTTYEVVEEAVRDVPQAEASPAGGDSPVRTDHDPSVHSDPGDGVSVVDDGTEPGRVCTSPDPSPSQG